MADRNEIEALANALATAHTQWGAISSERRGSLYVFMAEAIARCLQTAPVESLGMEDLANIESLADSCGKRYQSGFYWYFNRRTLHEFARKFPRLKQELPAPPPGFRYVQPGRRSEVFEGEEWRDQLSFMPVLHRLGTMPADNQRLLVLVEVERVPESEVRDETRDEQRRIAEELRRLQPARVPEGWQLVPRMATDEMLRAVSGWEETVLVAEDDHREYPVSAETFAEAYRAMLAAAPAAERGQPEPIRMVLHCPRCHVQHIDEPDERTPGWNNPPHRSHLCHACGCIWRPADVPTMGVASIETRGKADTWSPANPAPESREPANYSVARLVSADHSPGAGNMVAEAPKCAGCGNDGSSASAGCHACGETAPEAGQREGVDVEELAQWCDEQSKDPDNADGAVTLLVIAQTLRGLASAQQAGTGSRGEGGDAS